MKYIVVLCDGMADLPCPELNGKTPMELARKPNMDALAKSGEVGLARTVPGGMSPGSDVANLSVMGYDPAVCYTGRSPLEAVGMGVDLADDDLALRCNLVTLSDEDDYNGKTMVDYSGGDISTREAARLISAVGQAFEGGEFQFYPGVSYRHCLVWRGYGGPDVGELTPPHDISGRVVGEYLGGGAAAPLIHMMRRSADILRDHPVNLARIKKGLHPANSIWLWGQGFRPRLDNFEEKTGLKGAAVSAVDLLSGIGKCAGMRVCKPEGATGYIDTRFDNKVRAVLDFFDSGVDYVYLHIEAPDECGHRGEALNKIRSIELIDERVIGPLLGGMGKFGHFRMLVLPDHPTPLVTGNHLADPVPYILYDSEFYVDSGVPSFTEATAAATGMLIDPGHELLGRMLEN